MGKARPLHKKWQGAEGRDAQNGMGTEMEGTGRLNGVARRSTCVAAALIALALSPRQALGATTAGTAQKEMNVTVNGLVDKQCTGFPINQSDFTLKNGKTQIVKSGTGEVNFTILDGNIANTLKKGSAASLNTLWFNVTNAAGRKIVYEKVAGSSGLSVSENGTVTFAQGLKSGNYSIDILVTALENDNWASSTVRVHCGYYVK